MQRDARARKRKRLTSNNGSWHLLSPTFSHLFISVLTNPTMGGVAASFASLGDVVFAEPKALIGFAGPRTIKATIRIELSEGFQTSEFLLAHGFIDRIVPRSRLKSEIARTIDYCGK